MPHIRSAWVPYTLTSDFVDIQGCMCLEEGDWNVSSIQCSINIRRKDTQVVLYEGNAKVAHLHDLPPMTRWRMPDYVLSHPDRRVQEKLREMRECELEIRAVFQWRICQ